MEILHPFVEPSSRTTFRQGRLGVVVISMLVDIMER